MVKANNSLNILCNWTSARSVLREYWSSVKIYAPSISQYELNNLVWKGLYYDGSVKILLIKFHGIMPSVSQLHIIVKKELAYSKHVLFSQYHTDICVHIELQE